MSNTRKRKTRSQKEKAAERRAQRTTHRRPTTGKQPNSSSPSTEETLDQSLSKTSPHPTKKTPATDQRNRHTERLRLMRISIYVFGGLVAVQLTLWGLNYSGFISLNLM